MENPIKMDDLGVPLFLETPTLENPHVSIGNTSSKRWIRSIVMLVFGVFRGTVAAVYIFQFQCSSCGRYLQSKGNVMLFFFLASFGHLSVQQNRHGKMKQDGFNPSQNGTSFYRLDRTKTSPIIQKQKQEFSAKFLRQNQIPSPFLEIDLHIYGFVSCFLKVHRKDNRIEPRKPKNI